MGTDAWDVDLTVVDPDDGQPWDFNVKAKRDKAERIIADGRAMLLIGSPMCSAFSQLQTLNKWSTPEVVRNMRLQEARRHIEFCCKLYRMQLEQGLYFLHEHPKRALSWEEPSVKALLRDHRVMRVDGDMCMFGMSQEVEGERVSVMKPTTFMTNAPGIARRLSRKCKRLHQHAAVIGGKAKQAEVYPDE